MQAETLQSTDSKTTLDLTPLQLRELEIISTQYEAKAISYDECVEACREVQKNP
jgi:hypothetical protein